MKYNITPQNVPNALPITEEPLPAQEIAKEFAEFLELMEKQGFWRTTDGREIPLSQVSYKIDAISDGRK